jgi:flagellar basal body-associated protein FliL
MQRWIILGVVAVMLMLGGGAFGYWTLKQNRPYPVYVPIPINDKLSIQQRTDTMKDLRAKLGSKEILSKVSKDLGLASAFHVASEDAAVAELEKRLMVELGTIATQSGGTTPSLNIGVTGVKKDKDLSEKITMRLMDDVWKIIGVEPPKK